MSGPRMGNVQRAFYALAQRPGGATAAEGREAEPEILQGHRAHTAAYLLSKMGRVRKEAIPGAIATNTPQWRYFADPNVSLEQLLAQERAEREESQSGRLLGPKSEKAIKFGKRPGGFAFLELMEHMGLPERPARALVQRLVSMGRLHRGGQFTPYRWFANADEAAAYLSPQMSRGRALTVSAAREAPLRVTNRVLDPQQPTIRRDGVQVTTAEVPSDERFTVKELPPGYVSQLDPDSARGWAKAVVP